MPLPQDTDTRRPVNNLPQGKGIAALSLASQLSLTDASTNRKQLTGMLAICLLHNYAMNGYWLKKSHRSLEFQIPKPSFKVLSEEEGGWSAVLCRPG